MRIRFLLISVMLGCQLTSGQSCADKCQTSCTQAFSDRKRITACEKDCTYRCLHPEPDSGTTGGRGLGWGVLPYDVVWADEDLNGLPLNPRWWKQNEPQNPGLPSQQGPGGCSTPWDWHCTRVNVTIPPLTTDPENPVTFGCKFSGPLGQHADWFTVAYEGTALWEGHTPDNDDNINVTRTDQSAYTAQNPIYLHTEFSDDETLSHFSTPWWKRFHDAIGNGSAHDMIDNRDIIEVGILGLDCAHSCGSEIHPVYALALHVQNDPNDDTWAIFARNLGDEGFCAPDRIFEPLLFQKIYFKLPWPDDIMNTPPTVLTSTTWEKPYSSGDNVGVKTFPMFQGLRPAGFVVEIDLGGVESTNIIDGELHLQWHRPVSTAPSTPGAVSRPRVLAGSGRARPAVASGESASNPEPEKRFADWLGGLPPGVRNQISQVMSEKPAPPRMVTFRSTNLGQAPNDFQPRPTALGPGARSRLQVVPNKDKRDLYDKLRRIIHDNNVKVPH